MQRRSSSGVQGLIFGGLMAALVVVFALIPGFAFLMPIPLVLVFMRHGDRVAVMTAVVAILMTMAFRGVINGLLVIPSGILPGLIFGMGFRRQWKPLTIGLSAVAVFFVGYALSYAVMRMALFNGRDPIEVMVEGKQFREMWSMVTDMMLQSTASQAPANPTPAQAEQIANTTQMLTEMRNNPAGIYWVLLPSAVFIAGAVSSWVNWMLFKWTLPRFGYTIPQPVPFVQFRLPMWLVWVYGLLSMVAPFMLQGASSLIQASWAVKLLMNLISPLGMIFALAGVAVLYGYLQKKWNLKPGMAVLIIMLAPMVVGLGLVYQLLILVAMWDAIFDFRGLGHGLWKRGPEETT